MFTEFKIKGEIYKCRLTIEDCMELEKRLGKNPLEVVFSMRSGNLPLISDILAVLHQSMQSAHHDITMKRVQGMLQSYLEEHQLLEIIPTLIDIYKVSGLIKDNEEDEEPKN